MYSQSNMFDDAYDKFDQRRINYTVNKKKKKNLKDVKKIMSYLEGDSLLKDFNQNFCSDDNEISNFFDTNQEKEQQDFKKTNISDLKNPQLKKSFSNNQNKNERRSVQ